jgi:4-hydroxybenzoate polyprenyltransferase
MSTKALAPHGSLARRLWTYQAERFPLVKTGVLLAVFTSASINASAHLAGRPLPPASTYLVAFLVTLILFFHLRACDEVKDLDDDRRFRPERPIPRGLVSLRLIIGIAVGLGFFAAIITGLHLPALLVPLALVWLWMGLMTAEFFVPEWLKARPMLYLVSHMAIMPLIDLFITAGEWLRHAHVPAPALWLFLALSFANGTVLEIGRKLYAPENERTGVETYSGLFGPSRAGILWIGAVGTAYCLLVAVAMAMSTGVIVVSLGGIAAAVAVSTAFAYRRMPTPKAQARMDLVAGLWVFACYALAGFAPFLRGIPA